MINTVEWNDSQKKTINQLAHRLHWTGIFVISYGMLVIGIFTLIVLFIPDAQHSQPTSSVIIVLLVMASIFSLLIITGFWFRNAATALRSSVANEEGDFDLIISALTELKKAFGVAYAGIVITAVLSVIGIVLLLIILLMEKSEKARKHICKHIYGEKTTNVVQLNDSQKTSISQLAYRLYWIGFFTMMYWIIITGVFVLIVIVHRIPLNLFFVSDSSAALAMLKLIGTLGIFISFIALGFWLKTAAVALHASVAEEQEDRFTSMMFALAELKKAFDIIYGYVILFVILIVMSIIVTMFNAEEYLFGYIERSQMTKITSYMYKLRGPSEEFAAAMGVWPDVSDITGDKELKIKNATQLTSVGAKNRLLIGSKFGFKIKTSVTSNGWIGLQCTLISDIKKHILKGCQWKCGKTMDSDLPRIYLPPSCREKLDF